MKQLHHLRKSEHAHEKRTDDASHGHDKLAHTYGIDDIDLAIFWVSNLATYMPMVSTTKH